MGYFWAAAMEKVNFSWVSRLYLSQLSSRGAQVLGTVLTTRTDRPLKRITAR
jgi:hypothetical protein